MNIPSSRWVEITWAIVIADNYFYRGINIPSRFHTYTGTQSIHAEN